MAAYTHAMRQARPDKQKASVPGLALQAVWRTGLLAARITALVLFAICCQAWLFLLLGNSFVYSFLTLVQATFKLTILLFVCRTSLAWNDCLGGASEN